MSVTLRAEPTCPVCHGVSQHPEVEECHGCMECDFTGTLDGHALMQKLEREAQQEMIRLHVSHQEYIRRGICSQCGARSSEEAAGRCTATADCTGEYSCAGDDLWPEV